MKQVIIAGNWKMNKTVKETVEFIKKVKKEKLPKNVKIILCPPFTALSEAAKSLKGSNISLASQTLYYEEKGAFTGEISPLMLQETGCKYAIIGHSERRHIFGESDELINKKLLSAINHKLTPIFCIGETKEERQDGKTELILKNQISKGLNKVDVSKIIIAYEPVWAIGTGINATPKQAEESHLFIRSLIKQKYGENISKNLKLLYGGSVTPENAKSLLSQKNIDGLLVGGASLDLKKFLRIINP
jgi:triosephosphate isomerase